MASKSTLMGLALVVLVSVMCKEARAQSSCTTTLMGLSPCLGYVTGNSSTPSSACCSQLAAVVKSSPVCLCSLMNASGVSMGINNINQTLALALPRICNVQTPPVSQCNAVANGPASSPAASASPAPAASPESPTADASNPIPQSPTSATTTPANTTPAIPSGGASKTVPTSTSDGNLRKPALFLFFFALASIVAIF